MSEPIVFISRNKIKEGKTYEFRMHYQDSIPPTMAGKPGTLAQLAYENEEVTEGMIVCLFPSADASGVIVIISPHYLDGFIRPMSGEG